MAYKLLTETVLKGILGAKGLTAIPADEQVNIEMILNGVVGQIESYLDRKLEYIVDDVEILTPHYNRLYLSRYPIQAVDSIIPIVDGVFDVDNAIVASKYWFLNNQECGYIQTINGCWTNTIYQVTYTGGFDSYNQDDSTNYADPLPANIALALSNQFKYTYERRNSLGASGLSSPDGSTTIVENDGLLKSVKDTLNPYRRIIVI